MNKPTSSLSPELQRIEQQLAALVPGAEKERDLEVLHFLISTQLNEIKKQAAYTEKTKWRTFLLGGTLGLCLGAVLTFFVICASFPPEPSVPIQSVPMVESNILDATTAMPRTMTPELLREFVPPPSAFFVPFFIATLLIVSVTLLLKHVRVRLVV